MDEFEFYKDIYFREIDKRQKLNDAAMKSVSTSSIIAAVIFYLFREITMHPKLEQTDILILVLLIISFSSYCLNIVFIALSLNNLFRGYSYPELPSTEGLYNYQKELDGYNSSCDDVDKQEFKRYLLDVIINTSDKAIWINDRRSLFLYRSTTSIIVSTLLILICIIVYGLTFVI